MSRPLLLALALLPLLAVAQGPRPDWCDPGERSRLYPDGSYFVGFQQGFVRQGETLDAAVARLKTGAQGDAAQRIEVHVKSSSLDAVRSLQQQTAQGLDEAIVRRFDRTTSTSASLDIPNLQSLHWHDPATGEVDVLVYTRRRDFMRYFDRQLESLLVKMEGLLATVLEQERQGAQIKGRTTAEQALDLCPQVELAQRMVALADPEASMEDLQMPRYTGLVRQLSAAVARLRHATAFFIECHASIGGSPYAMLDKEVRGLLAAQGCHFTTDRASADWVVSIDASVINTAHRDGMAHFSYVDGTLEVVNGATGRKVLEDRLSALEEGHYDGIKGGDNSFERAARVAYRDAARIISQSILKLVQE